MEGYLIESKVIESTVHWCVAVVADKNVTTVFAVAINAGNGEEVGVSYFTGKNLHYDSFAFFFDFFSNGYID